MTVKNDKYFTITSVHRQDLKQAGFDTSKISDATMNRLASKMADDYCEQLFWDHLSIIADALDVPKLNGSN